MRIGATVALLVMAASASACQSETNPIGAEESVAAASEVGIDREACRVTLNASVRGVTGRFASAEAAARSVKEVPAEGRLVRFEVGEDSAMFGWEARGLLTHIIDIQRGDGGWTVGSYQECAGRS